MRDPVDHKRIQAAVREILQAVGEDPDREGLRDTPARVARMYAELFSGLHDEPRRHLRKFFTEKYDEVVLVRDISFNSMCEHHLLPFMGTAHVGYLPNGRVIGLSFFDPVDASRQIQITIGSQTSRETAERVLAFVNTLGKTPVVKGKARPRA